MEKFFLKNNQEKPAEKFYINQDELHKFEEAYPDIDKQVLKRLFEAEAYFSGQDTDKSYDIQWVKGNEDIMADPIDVSIKQGEVSFNIKSLFPPQCNFILGKKFSFDPR